MVPVVPLHACYRIWNYRYWYTRGQKSGILQFMSLFFKYCETMVLKVGSLFRKAVLLVPICESINKIHLYEIFICEKLIYVNDM